MTDPAITWRLDIYKPGGDKLTDFTISSPDEQAVRTALLDLCENFGIELSFHHKMMLRAGTLRGAINDTTVSWFRIMQVLPMPRPEQNRL